MQVVFKSGIEVAIMGRYFGGRSHVGKPRGRWENAVCKYSVGLFQIRNWKSAARAREVWRKEIGKATSRELAEKP
jgi:hypothetical protein